METTVNIHEAKTHLSRLVEQAANGHTFIIAKACKPMVRVVALAPTEPLTNKPKLRKLGFMVGMGIATADIKRDFAADIEEMFYGPNSGLFPAPEAKQAKSARPAQPVKAALRKTATMVKASAAPKPTKKVKSIVKT